MNPEKTDSPKKNSSKCMHKYSGWTPILTFCLIGLIGTVIIISLGGPWYHDCGHADCRVYYDYGIYCDDYCLYYNYGPGPNLAAVAIVASAIICFIPLCWPSRGRTPRYIFE